MNPGTVLRFWVRGGGRACPFVHICVRMPESGTRKLNFQA